MYTTAIAKGLDFNRETTMTLDGTHKKRNSQSILI